MKPPPNETYLGDGLYASCAANMLTLRAPRAGGDHYVHIEFPEVYNALLEYVADLVQQAEERAKAKLTEQSS